MADHAVLPATRDAARVTPGTPSDEDLRALRAILIGPAERRLEELQAKLDDRFSHAREVGAVLPQALLTRARDPELARALMAPVEKAVADSIRKDPKPLADAIFPIIGPAIRRAVAASLAAMVDSFNRALEHSISWRALRWRLEAFRTGRPFGEVVLLHTLVYRVEQVFLIHLKTGLLLQHVRAGHDRVEDAQLVSAMLTAIRDFVHDSFRLPESESLDAVQVGDLQVWIEQGPLAVAAMVTRGTPPRELRTILQRTVESVHLQHAEALLAFDGDTQPFEAARPLLEDCLQAEYRAATASRTRRIWIAVVIALLALGTWMAFSLRERGRWNRYIDALENEPGIVVISSGRSGGRYIVAGLRDPLSRDPEAILRDSRVPPGDVVSRWEPYHALTPAFVLARAHKVLQPPDDTTLTLNNGVLVAGGIAPAAWIRDAARLAPLVAGISAFDHQALAGSSLRSRIGRIEAATLLFVRGSSTLLDGQEDDLGTIAADVRELDALAALAGQRVRLEIVGHTDSDGAQAMNQPLSRARAEAVRRSLAVSPTPAVDVAAVGVGSSEPRHPGETEPDKQGNRRVSFRVTTAPAGVAGPVR